MWQPFRELHTATARARRQPLLLPAGVLVLLLLCAAPVHATMPMHAEAPAAADTAASPTTAAPDEGTIVRVVSALPAGATTGDADAPLTFALLDVAPHLSGATNAWVPASGQILGRVVDVAATADGTAEAAADATAGITYTVDLPILPAGAAGRDDGEGATVQIYEAMAAPRMLGDGYLQLFEQRADLRSLARDLSTGQVVSGTALIFVTGDDARFPADAGADGAFFTDDDVAAPIPAGYSLATLDNGTVTLTQPRLAAMPLLSGAAPTVVDFSALAQGEAYDAMLAHLADHGGLAADGTVDWAALGERTRAEVDAAVAAADSGAFFRALVALAQSAGDGLVTVELNDGASPAVAQASAALQGAGQGSLGVEVAELDDGRITVVYVAPGSQAATAGIKPGMELRAVNGTPVADALTDARFAGFPGTDEGRRLAQLAGLLRAPLESEVALELATPGGAVQTITLTAGQYPTRRLFSVAGQPMPASYRFLNNTGYLALSDFARAPVLLALVEDFLVQLNARNGEGVILDLRGNTGGSLPAMLTAASYFFTTDAPLDVAALVTQELNAEDGSVLARPWADGTLSAPAARAAFDGPVTLLVDDGCRGACELMAALFQATGRGTIVAQYPTAGITGDAATILLPDGITVTYPRTLTAVAADAGVDSAVTPLHGSGVQADVRVPVTLESETAKATGNDPLLTAALDYLELVQLEPVPVTFDFVGVTSVGPRGWRYDDGSRQLRRADGTGLTVIPQQGEDVSAAVAEFVGNFQGEAEEVETLTFGERTWTLFAGTLFGQNVRIAATVEGGDTLLTVLFVTNPAQVEQLTDKVLLPFLEKFTLDTSTAL